MAKTKQQKSRAALEKEWALLLKQERTLAKSALRPRREGPSQALASKLPPKVYENLQGAFCTAFRLIFQHGTGIIERGYDRSAIREDREIQDFAFQVKADRKSLRQTQKSARSSNLRNMALTTAEGMGLGLLGIGLPDIVIFVGMLLKGIYEVALRYGFDYDTPEERYFILKLMECAMLRGPEWEEANAQADQMIQNCWPGGDIAQRTLAQIQRTADCFALDMVVLKFLQGLPLVGLIGGMGNPVYYSQVMKYVELKYRKRHLHGLLAAYGES